MSIIYMLTFWESLILASITGLLSGAATGSIVSYLFNKKLDRHQRVMEMRKQIYSDTQEKLAGFFNTATDDIRQKSIQTFLSSLRQAQLWAAKDVIKQFNRFLFAIDKKNEKSQEEIDQEYKKLVSKMREDLTGELINEEDIEVYGKIS